MDPTFVTRNLAIGYASTHNIVLEHIDLDLKGGGLICLIGTNGIGKSTLIRTICGLQKKIFGSVEVNGFDIDTLSGEDLATHISVVLTDPVHAGNLTAYELVALGRYPHTNWLMNLKDSDIQAIDKAIKIVGIEELVHTNIPEEAYEEMVEGWNENYFGMLIKFHV